MKKVFFIIMFLFVALFSADESKAQYLCDNSGGLGNEYSETCPLGTGHQSLCNNLHNTPSAACPTNWSCTVSCLAACSWTGGVTCATAPAICTDEYVACGCTCPGGGGGGGGGVPGVGCAAPPGDADGDGDPCDYDLGENMFNCPADCLPAGIPSKLIPDVIDSIISWLLTFAVAISVLALVYGGTCYVFSSGDAQKAENAKKTVKYALLGIFIAGISFAIIIIIDMVFH